MKLDTSCLYNTSQHELHGKGEALMHDQRTPGTKLWLPTESVRIDRKHNPSKPEQKNTTPADHRCCRNVQDKRHGAQARNTNMSNREVKRHTFLPRRSFTLAERRLAKTVV
jgi:hypothetical protein